jgi:hypothetical protein
VKQSTGPRGRVRVDGTGARVVSQAGGVLLIRTAAAVGLPGCRARWAGGGGRPRSTTRERCCWI